MGNKLQQLRTEEVEHLLACDILFNARVANVEVERIIFCSREVVRGQSKSSSPQKQSLNDPNMCVCVLQREKTETMQFGVCVCRLIHLYLCVCACYRERRQKWCSLVCVCVE